MYGGDAQLTKEDEERKQKQNHYCAINFDDTLLPARQTSIGISFAQPKALKKHYGFQIIWPYFARYDYLINDIK